MVDCDTSHIEQAIGIKATEAMQIIEEGSVVRSDFILAGKITKSDQPRPPVVRKNIEEPVGVKTERFV